MKFTELDDRMRQYETAHDHCVLPGIYMVARLDGRGFTSLTKREGLGWQRPFDVRFRNLMVATTRHLVESTGFNVIYGYTESDEISLLFSLTEGTFGRKIRKYNSTLAGTASAVFTSGIASMMPILGTFDCRISQLPNKDDVVDYFRWRNEDAARNALSAYCHYTLMDSKGCSATAATKLLHGKGQAAKHEILFDLGINFNDLPAWQKRGVGLYWEEYIKIGLNPRTSVSTRTTRRRVVEDCELPMKQKYSEYVGAIVEEDRWVVEG